MANPIYAPNIRAPKYTKQILTDLRGFPGGSVVKNLAANAGDSGAIAGLGGLDSKVSVYNAGDPGSIPGLGRSSGEGNSNPLQDFCRGKFHGWRNFIGYSPQGHKELDTTE